MVMMEKDFNIEIGVLIEKLEVNERKGKLKYFHLKNAIFFVLYSNIRFQSTV